MNNFHAFKQRDWKPERGEKWPHEIEPVFERLLEKTKWTNFFDRRDYVSGSLDYYHELENVDLQFKSNIFSFTHSDYWTSEKMFNRIIQTFLIRSDSKTVEEKQ